MIIRNSIRRSLLIAAAYLLLTVTIKELARRHFINSENFERLTGMLLGALVVVYANAIPKTLVPLTRISCDPAREQAFRRFGGWTLVLGGLGFMLAQALAPAQMANMLAACLLGVAVILVGIAVVHCSLKRRPAE
jgi:hypothetical protein